MNKKIFRLIALSFGFSYNLVFCIIFYKMLINSNPNVILKANMYNEFWIEIIFLSFSLLYGLIAIILEFTRDKKV